MDVIRLSAKDSSILGRIAQYDTIPMKDKLRLLHSATAIGRLVGYNLLGIHEHKSFPEVEVAADAIREWARKNKE